MDKTKTVTISFDRKTVAKIIAAVAAILCFVGLFGVIMKHYSVRSALGQTQSELERVYDLSYIFKDSWNWFKVIPGNTGAMKFSIVLMIISFFVGIGGFVFVVGKIIYSIYKKEEIKFNLLLTIMLVTSVQYLFMSRFACGYNGNFDSISGSEGYDYSSKTVYTMGWGAILITIGFFLGLISSFIYDFDGKDSVVNKNSICRRIASIAIFFIGIYGLANLVYTGTTDTYDGGLKQINGGCINSFWLVVAADKDSIKTLGIFAIIFGLISYLSLACASVFFIKGGNSKLDKKLPLISSIVFTVTSLASNVFMSIAGFMSTETSNDIQTIHNIDPGFTAIVSLILGIGLIILAAIANKEKRLRNK